MFRYLLVFSMLFTLTFGACQNNEGEQEQSESGQSMGEQMQPQQPVDTDVSDRELDQFVEATIRAQEIQIKSQNEMASRVEDEGISVERFNEIAEAQQKGQSEDEIGATSDEMDSFEKAMEAIQELNQEVQPEVEKAIEDEGISMNRFQEINMAIQQDQELQQQVRQRFQEIQLEQQDQQ